MFRATVTAFCSLTRPTRREIAQVEDLTLPLYPDVSADTRRYAAAALSECVRGPAALVRRLAAEPIDVAAPLLVRSQLLLGVDLIAIIGRCGLAHARAIGCRPDLEAPIADLVRKLEAASSTVARAPAATVATPEIQEIDMAPVQKDLPGALAEATRSRLRTFMAGGGQSSESPIVRQAIRSSDVPLFERLRSTALSGTPALFQTALADALDVDFSQARALSERNALPALSLVLRGLGLAPEQAFLIAAAIHPGVFAHAEAIRLFLDRFTMSHSESGRDEIRRLRAERLASMVQGGRGLAPLAAAPDGAEAPARLLRAS